MVVGIAIIEMVLICLMMMTIASQQTENKYLKRENERLIKHLEECRTKAEGLNE
ncbi:hypothetical protein [Miniphocaeibacter massiliensis]|uniref:hypothetical protein n=1 Tax=Miniphocaeibacter massiliensis TaxID=2041841 RepID=UPI0013EA78F4|nr:hypothetical protein [Miniphocaeibacter massiliensis]